MIVGVQPYTVNRPSGHFPRSILSSVALKSLYGNNADEVRFGLKNAALKNHPAYHRRLVIGEDVILGDFGTLHPTAKLVSEVADIILKDSLEAPRALVITNVTDFFPDFDYQEGSKDFEEVHNFQSELFDRAWQRIKTIRYPQTQPQDFIVHRMDQLDGPRGLRYPRPGELSVKQSKMKFPVDKTPQICADDIIHTYSYGPIKNVEGGHIRLVDFMQYMQDKRLRFRDLFYDEASEGRLGYFMRNKWIGKSLEPYSVEVKTYSDDGEKAIVPIVFVNNEKMAILPLPTIPDSRLFEDGIHQLNMYRITVKPKRESAYWQKKAPYPLHTKWLYTDPVSNNLNVSRSKEAAKQKQS